MTVNLWITSEEHKVKFLVDSGKIAHAAGHNYRAISDRWRHWTLVSGGVSTYYRKIDRVELLEKYGLDIHLIMEALTDG